MLTVLGYLVSPYGPRAAGRPKAAREPGSLAVAGWLDRNGPLALGVEFVVMLVSGVTRDGDRPLVLAAVERRRHVWIELAP